MPNINLTKLIEIINSGKIKREEITVDTDNISKMVSEPNNCTLITMTDGEMMVVAESRTEVRRLSREQ